MAFDVGDLIARLKVDTGGFTAGLSGAENALSGFKGTLLSLGLGAVFLGIAKESFAAAAKMEQVGRAFTATFGDLSEKAEAFATRLSATFKLNLSDVQERMAKTQRALEGMKFDPAVALQMNEQLERMSLDLASLWGQRPEEVSQKLTMGLMGATRGLRSLGIVIDENVLKQVALKYHLGEMGEKFDREQKAMLTYLAILDRSGKAAGDFAAHLDSPTNRLYLFHQAVDDLKESLGVRLMPAMGGTVSLLTSLARTLTGAASSFASWPPILKATAEGLMAVVGGLALLKLGVVAVGLLTTAFTALNPILLTVAATLGVIAGIYALLTQNTATPLAPAEAGMDRRAHGAVGTYLRHRDQYSHAPLSPLEQAQQEADRIAAIFRGIFGAGTGGAAAKDAAKAFEDLIKSVTAVIEANLTPLEKYRHGVAALDQLFATGTLSTMDYDREVARLGVELDTTTASLLAATKAAQAAQTAIERPRLDIVAIPLDAFDATLTAIQQRVAPLSFNIGRSISEGIAGGIGNLAATMGSALGKGENIFKAFAGGIRALLGQMMVTIGQSLIATAAARIAFDALLAFSPVAALAIGVGLVAAGTALSGGGAGYGGGGATGGGGYYAPATQGGQGQGSMTIVFPAHSVFDPSDPTQMDAFVNMMEQASGRNIIVQRRA